MSGQNFADHGAEIGGQGEVAAFIKLLLSEPGPLPTDAAALDVPTHEEHAVSVAMIGAAAAGQSAIENSTSRGEAWLFTLSTARSTRR